MQNTWIVVPIVSNDYDLTDFIDKLTSSYVCPENYRVPVLDQHNGQTEYKDYPHPYAGQTSTNFSNRIIFVNTKPGYTEYSGVVHLEDFEEINIYRCLNAGIEYAKSHGADSIVLLNGALKLDTFVFNEGYKTLKESNKKVVNLFSNAVIMVSSDCDLRFNERYQIWFADNEFYFKAQEVSEVEYANISFWYLDYIIPQNSIESFDEIVRLDEEKWNSRND